METTELTWITPTSSLAKQPSIPMEKGRLFRLNDNWVSVAIGHLDSFGDVGCLHPDFLEKLLPHCSMDQLVHIERCTKVDLTPITNKLWKTFFQRDFGGRATDEMMQGMKMIKNVFKWSEAYEAKSKSVEQDEKEVGERLKKMYQQEAARKQSRQIRVLDKVPSVSSSNKRIGSNKASKPLNRNSLLNSLELKRKMRMTAANPYGRSSFNPRRTQAYVF